MEEPETYNGKGIGERLGRLTIGRASKYFEDLKHCHQKQPAFQRPEEAEVIGRAAAEERATYNNYLNILVWIGSTRGRANVELEKAKQEVGLFLRFINDAIQGETFTRYVDRQPVIMTGWEFIQAQEQGKEAYFSKDGKDVSLTAYDLLIEAVEFYLAMLEKYPTTPNPLAEVKEIYKGETVKSQFVLDHWYEANSIGYYTLVSGKKSALMTKAEYDSFLDKEYSGLLCDIIANHLDHGFTDFEESLKADPDGIYGIKWSAATSRPRKLTKWEAVACLGKLYAGAKDLTDLAEEFRELIAAILQRLVVDHKIDLRGIPVAKWGEPYITRRKLYKLGFYFEKQRADNYYREKEKDGVAVIQGVANVEPGYYAKPEEALYREGTLEGYMEGGRWASRIDLIKATKERLLDSCYFIRGYNWAIEQIAETQGAPGFLNCRVIGQELTARIDTANSHIKLLFSIIMALPLRENLRTKKLEIIKDYFLIPRVDLLRIPAENKRKALRLIKNLTAFTGENFTALYPLILSRPKEGPADEKPAAK